MINQVWYQSGLAFSCRKCGRCCAGPEEGYVWVTERELAAIADYLQLSPEETREKYLRREGARYSLIEKEIGKDCIFLNRTEEGYRCAIYPVRPLQCRTWPFWKENLRTEKQWREIGVVCPGVDQDQWYAADRIEAIREGDSERHVPDMDLAEAAWRWIEAGRNKKAYLAAVEQLYAIVDQHLAGAESDCEACGQCCQFEKFNHRLFVTSLEMLYLIQGVEKLGLEVKESLKCVGQSSTLQFRCPFQKGNQCVARAFRPTGCRIFFCRGLDKNYQHELAEETLRQLRQFHQQFKAVYYYADLADWLTGYHRYHVGK
jgi:uncharacterized protein